MAHPGASGSYQGAASHYLSPHRRDAVKRIWEEPVNHQLLARAIEALPALDRPLQVLDIGAGTGDGLALLEGALPLTTTPHRPVRYLGLDPDEQMIRTATRTHRHRPDVQFVVGDVRDMPIVDADLYLSAGVPYSHLDPTDFVAALARVLTGASHGRAPAAVVIDVLGRYSIEWTTRWSTERWNYPMSFFEGTGGDEPITTPMTFYDRWSLTAALDLARRHAGAHLVSVDFVDRSVMVGRHTTTGAFTPHLPNYRSLINKLHDGDTGVDLEALRFEAPHAGARVEVLDFFAHLEPAWNHCLDRAAGHEARVGVDPLSRRRLADRLCALERATQQGLGVAHTLICLAVVAPASASRRADRTCDRPFEP